MRNTDWKIQEKPCEDCGQPIIARTRDGEREEDCNYCPVPPSLWEGEDAEDYAPRGLTI